MMKLLFRNYYLLCLTLLPTLVQGRPAELQLGRSITSTSTDHGGDKMVLDRMEQDGEEAHGNAISLSQVDPSLQATPSSQRSRELFVGFIFDILQGLFVSPNNDRHTTSPSSQDGSSGVEDLPSTENFTPLRINCGGSAIQDSEGIYWIGDSYHNSVGRRASNLWNSWLGTEDAALFQSYRLHNRIFQWEPMKYEIPVPNGKYQVTLYFAEMFLLFPNLRRFDVLIENEFAFSSVNIVDESGQQGSRKAMAMTRTVTVEDGNLLIEFDAINRDPYISAIEVQGAADAQIGSPTDAPIVAPAPTDVPTRETEIIPTTLPAKAPTGEPASSPTTSPKMPTGKPRDNLTPTPSAQIIWTTKSPSVPPTESPFSFPSGSRTLTPVNTQTDSPTTEAPTPSPKTPAPTDALVEPEFGGVRINAGGDKFVDFLGNVWLADDYFLGGSTYADGSNAIAATQSDLIYQTERYGIFQYEIPLPVANYEVRIHLAEIYFDSTNARKFDIEIEGETAFKNVDIVALGLGESRKAMTVEKPQLVEDGFLSISFLKSDQSIDNPKVSAIEVKLVEDHLAHAVSNGPYIVTDTDESGSEVISVDGGLSHTHAIGETVVEYIWRTGSTILGTGENAELTLPVGVHTVTLTVIDSAGNDSTEETTVTVVSGIFPSIEKLVPDSGSIVGGNEITVIGSGFSSPAADTIVKFGNVELSDFEVVDKNTIKLVAPPASIGAPVEVTVETTIGLSNGEMYTYVAASAISFSEGWLTGHESPTRVAFGPDGNLYVGDMKGYLTRYKVDKDMNLLDAVTSWVSKWRPILGIAFDPLDTKSIPDVYISHSYFYHKEWKSSSGEAVNGKISKVSGANLDVVVDIVTGLPVSDHDHGVNGITFGNNGELYIQVGGNTNGGLPGQLSGSQLQKENGLSAATLVAYLSKPDFDGFIKYNDDDDGDQVAGLDVEVFAAGNRNPFGIVLHSNGNLYGTDNGPNYNYGNMATSCDGSFIDDATEEDKINLLRKGYYYGHANLKRGESDSRQCKWQSAYSEGVDGYTPPLMVVPSSTDGIIEFEADFFDRQMRGDLIVSKYNDALFRVILNSDGTAVLNESKKPIKLAGGKGLDVAQAPDGTLVEARLSDNALYYYKPEEQPSPAVAVKTVFPRRGGKAGGSILNVYGNNFNKGGATPNVAVGNKTCNVVSSSDTKIQCNLPGGSGTVDVKVTVGSESYTFQSGFRYITGF